MVVHQGTAIFSGTGGLQADASIRVTKADQLPEALGQRTKPVIIDFGIERGFKIDASVIHDWKIERTEGKITLTPYSK